MNWWPEYSYGVQASGRKSAGVRRKCANSPFYRYGFENPPKDYDSLYQVAASLPWKEIMAGVEFGEPPSRMDEIAHCRRCDKRKTGRRERSTCLCLECESETSCIHRRGMGWHEDQAMQPCAAGVVLNELTGREPGCGLKKPCSWLDDGEPVECKHFQPTPIEQLIADDGEMDASLARFMLVGPLVRKIKEQHKGKSWSGVEECPACKGELHISHAASNGHVHGRCDTEGCLSWME